MDNYGIISRYRQEIMGFATILIILCHANVYGVEMPRVLSKILSFGNYGVDIFLFVSGFGLFYSLSKTDNLVKWYGKRYLRILLPYLLIFVPIWIYRTYCSKEDVLYFLYHISTLSYWIDHEDAWFVALLIPLYLITPWLYKKFSDERKRTLYLAIGILCLSVLSLSLRYGLFVKKGIEYNIIWAVMRCTSYLLGLYCAPIIMRGGRINVKYVIISLVLFFSLRLLKIEANGWALVTPACLMICLLSQISMLSKVLKFFGAISLESYLLNISLISLCKNDFVNKDLLTNNMLLNYSIIFVFGTLLSYLVHIISQNVIRLSTK